MFVQSLKMTMQNSQTLDEIIKRIRQPQKSLVLSHQNPDGDTLGSMLALGNVLTKLGHEVDHVVSDPVPEVYKFLRLLLQPELIYRQLFFRRL